MSTRKLIHGALAIAMLTVGAWIKIPFFLVPISLQMFAVFFNLLVFEASVSRVAIIVYVLMGLFGLPVFTNGGGLQYVFQPSFGYLIGFVFATFILTTSFAKQLKGQPWTHLLLGVLIIYFWGFSYFNFLQSFYLSTNYSFAWMGVYLVLVFLPGDALSLTVVALLSKRLHKKITEKHLL